MEQESQPVVGRLSRRVVLAGGALAAAAALTTAMIWADGASASGALGGVAAGVRCSPAPGNPGGCFTGSTSVPPSSVPPSSVPPTSVPPTSVPPTSVPPSTPTGPVSTRTSYAWNFEDGTPDGWFGFSRHGNDLPPWNVLPPWVAPSADAAASGRGGLAVGGVAGNGTGAAVSVDRTVVAPGTYTVTARVRLAAGQPGTAFEIDERTTPNGTAVTDEAWTTLSGSLTVPGNGTPGRIVVALGSGYCEPSPSARDFAPATAFQLDQVTITRSSGVTVSPPQTTAGNTGCYTYSPLPPATAMIHYEVTGTSRNGFAATVVLTNLRDTPITSWAVPLNARVVDRRITWVSGARVVTVSSSTGSQTKLVGLPGATDIPAHGRLRLSVGLSGSPVGSAYAFTSIDGQQTGRN